MQIPILFDRLPRIDPDPDLHRHIAPHELSPDLLLCLDCRLYCRAWHRELRHERIADRLDHPAAVPRHCRLHHSIVQVHDLPHLRIPQLCEERCAGDDIGEEHRAEAGRCVRRVVGRGVPARLIEELESGDGCSMRIEDAYRGTHGREHPKHPIRQAFHNALGAAEAEAALILPVKHERWCSNSL